MTNPERLDSLDLLRGLAISMVVIFHTAIFFQPKYEGFQFMGYGAHGVQLFFLISAVTMAYMWSLREGEQAKTVKFYIRRTMRIAPVFWFAAVFYFLVKWVKGEAGDLHIWDFIVTTIFIHGFQPSTNNVLVPGGWSIGVEMFFYAFFPLVIGWVDSNKKCFLGFLLSFSLFNILLTELYKFGFESGFFYVNHGAFKEYLYQSVCTQLPVFFMGIFLYRVVFLKDRSDILLISFGFFVFLIYSFGLKYFSSLEGRPFFWLVCFLLMLLVAWVVLRRVGNFFLQYVGQISYSMYIFHFVVLDFFHSVVPLSLRGNWFEFLVWLVVVYSSSVVVSVVSKKYLEGVASNWSRKLVEKVVL